MTGKEIFALLTKDVQEKIKVNVRAQIESEFPSISVDKRMEYLMDDDYANVEGYHEKYWFMICLFKWSHTPEGHLYWDKIANS